jgi:signal transduction histidine kinase
MWLLLFRWAALSLALAQSFLIEAERLPQAIPQLILVALYTLGWTILALRPAQEATTIMHRRWFVGGDAIALITLNLATGGWHSPLYRYTFAALTMPPYLFGRRGLWGSLALLVAWHGGIAWQQRLPAHVITALALDGMMFGGLLTLSAYALHLVEAQRRLAVQRAAAEERLRIARDLHDDAVQQVYSIVLLLKGALRHSADEGGRQEVQRVYAQAVQTWEGLRRYLRDLRDPLDTRTFSERLRQGADAFTRLTGIPVDLDLDEVDLPEETGLQMLAITREALSNVYRHARARSVALRLRVVDETLMLEIADDGVGFDPQAVTALEGGYGLRGIAERVALLDGAWNIVSQPGQGTRVQVHLPFRPAPLEEEEKAE